MHARFISGYNTFCARDIRREKQRFNDMNIVIFMLENEKFWRNHNINGYIINMDQ